MRLLSVILFFLPLISYSQTLSPLSSPESSGISTERLNRIDKMLTAAVANNEVPGAVILIARNGKIVHQKAFGNATPQEKLKTDHIFRIASQTKAITSTAVMMLWEEGLFKLDDPISKYLPEFLTTGILKDFNAQDSSFTTQPVNSPITIRQLLTHTSGIGYGILDDDSFRKMYQKAGIIDVFTARPVLLKDNVQKIAQMPLHFSPGEKYKYSESIDVLGRLIEVLSGKTLEQFFTERIFRPLEMTDTHFYLPKSKEVRLVDVQTLKENKWITITDSTYFDPNYPVSGSKTFFSGGAGLSSTVFDYAKFLQMFLNEGIYNKTRLLSRTTINFMMTNQIGDLWAGGNEDLGLAFSVVNKTGADKGGLGSEGTFSWGGYFNTQYFADPKEKIIGIIFKQTKDIKNDNTGWKFRQMVFQTINN